LVDAVTAVEKTVGRFTSEHRQCAQGHATDDAGHDVEGKSVSPECTVGGGKSEKAVEEENEIPAFVERVQRTDGLLLHSCKLA
jgi:hypothetical protein